MMLGEHHRPNPTIHVPPWTQLDTDDLTAEMFYSSGAFNANGSSAYSPVSPTYHHHLHESPTALQRYLQSNDSDPDSDPELSGREADAPIDAYSCDHFRMYEFKVRKCARGRSHDWTECPYAHPGEKARRRDPRKYHYSGSSCPEFRKGNCVKGDACELAHGVFESWLHPARYRTQPCKDGTSCRRRVCFFAHTPDQLRILPHSYDGSGSGLKPFLASSLSVSPPMSPLIESPPMSPLGRLSFGSSTGMGTGSISEMVASLRNIQLGKVKSLPSSRNVQFGGSSPVFGTSPRGSLLRPGFYSVPTTPTQGPSRNGFGYSDMWDPSIEEEPEMELVESGRDLREKMLEKIKMESSMMCPDPSVGAPDVGWVSELLQ